MKRINQYLFLVRIQDYPTLVSIKDGALVPLHNSTVELNIVSPSADECMEFVSNFLKAEVSSIKEKHGLTFREKYKIIDCSNKFKVDVISSAN